MNTQRNLSTEQHAAFYSYLTVNQFCDKHRAFRVGGIRSLIFNEKTNGLVKFGAVVRLGGKVLINESKFFAWVEAQNNGGVK
jgi:hypothetical protein